MGGGAVNTELARFNPFDPSTLQCPFPHYAGMRATAPVLALERLGAYIVTRHDLVLRVLRDHTTFSSAFGAVSMPVDKDERQQLRDVLAEGYPRIPTLLTVDPPEHTRYRQLVAQHFIKPEDLVTADNLKRWYGDNVERSLSGPRSREPYGECCRGCGCG